MAGSLRGVGSFDAEIAAATAAMLPSVVPWRRNLHQHPGLGNRGHRTAALVAGHLRAPGPDAVQTGMAHTGVVSLLRGDQPGPVVALRADRDAQPVVEEVDLPLAPKVRTLCDDTLSIAAHGRQTHAAIPWRGAPGNIIPDAVRMRGSC